MNKNPSTGLVTIDADPTLTGNEDLCKYWASELSLFNGLHRRTKVTFKCLIRGKRSFKDKVLFRHPLVVKQFTTDNVYGFSAYEKGSTYEGKVVTDSFLHVLITSKDEERFLCCKPVTKDNEIIFGTFIVCKQGFFDAIRMQFSDIVTVTVEEHK